MLRSNWFDVTVSPSLLETSPASSLIPTGLNVGGGYLNLRHAIFIARKSRHAAMTGKYPPLNEWHRVVQTNKQNVCCEYIVEKSVDKWGKYVEFSRQKGGFFISSSRSSKCLDAIDILYHVGESGHWKRIDKMELHGLPIASG